MNPHDYDEQVQRLQARAGQIKSQLHELALAALTDPALLSKRALLREELDCLPAQIGELTRLRTLAQFAEWRAQAAELQPQFQAASALDDEYRARNRACRQAVERNPNSEQGRAAQIESVAIKEPSRAAELAYQKLRSQLQAVYNRAISAGVLLDQTREQRYFERHMPLAGVALAEADSAAHWGKVAAQRGREAEDVARRELVGNVLLPRTLGR